MRESIEWFWWVGDITYYLNNADKNREQLKEEAHRRDLQRTRNGNALPRCRIIEAVQPGHGGNYEDQSSQIISAHPPTQALISQILPEGIRQRQQGENIKYEQLTCEGGQSVDKIIGESNIKYGQEDTL